MTHFNGGESGINTFAYDRLFDEDDYTYGSQYYRDAFKENQMEQLHL